MAGFCRCWTAARSGDTDDEGALGGLHDVVGDRVQLADLQERWIGKNAGNHTSVAAQYRASAEAAPITCMAQCDLCRPVGVRRTVAAQLLLDRVPERSIRRQADLLHCGAACSSRGGGREGRSPSPTGTSVIMPTPAMERGKTSTRDHQTLKRSCSLVRPLDAARRGRGRAAGWSVGRCSRLRLRRTPRAASP